MRANPRDAVLAFPTILQSGDCARADAPAPGVRGVRPNSGAGVGAIASASTVEARAHIAAGARASQRSPAVQVVENATARRTSWELDQRHDVFARVGRWFGNSESVAKYLEIGTRYTLLGGVAGGFASAFVLPFFIGLPGVNVGLGVMVASVFTLNTIWGWHQAH